MTLLKITLVFRTVLDLEKNCKASKELPYTPHLVSPINILY